MKKAVTPSPRRRASLRGSSLMLIPVLAMGVAGCGPITPTAQPTPTIATPISTPTPTPTLTPTASPEQQAAEQKVLDMNQAYWLTITGQGDPNRLYQVLRNRDGGMEGYVASYFRIYSQTVGAGMKAAGERPVVVVSSTPPSEADGRQVVFVDTCIDNRAWSFVDKNGKKVAAEAVVEPVTFEVQQWPADGWYVVGEKDGRHTCET